MSPKCTCSSSGGGAKLAAVVVAGLVIASGAHAAGGHKPAAAVVADAFRPASGAQGMAAVSYARAQLGHPYVWGGTGPGGFDCSGLVMRAWQHAGVRIARRSQDQWRTLPHISRAQLRPGDLVFYAGSDGTQRDPGHVVMYVGDGNVIQAFGLGVPVEISPFNAVDAGPLTGYARPGGA